MIEQEMDFENRIVSPDYSYEDTAELSLRPTTLSEYIGQDKVKENLNIYIKAAVQRKEALDHVLLYGPPGLGKTTLSGIIARELGVNLRVTSGPAIEKQGDLVAILTSLNRVTYYSSMKFTVCPVTLRKFCTPQWRIFRLILFWARVRLQGL